MPPHTQARKKRNSSKVNLFISFAFHALIVVVILYFAARQGWLGEPLKKITVQMVKEKAPVKPKPPEPKPQPPREETQTGRGAQARRDRQGPAIHCSPYRRPAGC